MDSLRHTVAHMQDSLDAQMARDPRMPALLADSSDALIEIDRGTLERIVEGGTKAFLSDVLLHVRPDAEVAEEGDVEVDVGPLTMGLGSWRVQVTFQEITARLRVDSVEVAVADSNRLSLTLGVHARDAEGTARIWFGWDASAVPGVLCEDFEVSRVVEATVAPRTYLLQGYFAFRPVGAQLVADPEQIGQIRIRPEAPAEAWDWVRDVLRERDSLLDCGLGIDPERIESDLRALLQRGFDFRLPPSVLKPIPLPASLASTVTWGGQEVELDPEILTLVLDAEGLRYGVRLHWGTEP